MRICERSSSADTNFSEEGQAGGVPDARAVISLQPVMKTMMKQTITLQLMGYSEAEQVDVTKGVCKPMALWTHEEREAHIEADLVAGFVIPWGKNVEADCS